MAYMYHFTSAAGYAALTSYAAPLNISGVPRGHHGEPTDLSGNKTAVDSRYAPQRVFGGAIVGYMSLLIQFPSPDGRVAFLEGFDADADYGIGWYVTDLEPSSKTADLLEHLWRGDITYAERTAHWLRLDVGDARVVLPDKTRPYVKFVPFCTGLAFVGNPLMCEFTSGKPLYLVTAGSRHERRFLGVSVTERFRPMIPPELVPGYKISIEHFSQLSRIQQASVLRGIAPRAAGDRDSFELFCDRQPGAVGGLAAGTEQHRVRIVANIAVR